MIINVGPLAGRNKPCRCGSGLKFKRCCHAPRKDTSPTFGRAAGHAQERPIQFPVTLTAPSPTYRPAVYRRPKS